MPIELTTTSSNSAGPFNVYRRDDGTYIIVTESAMRAERRKLGRLYKLGRNVTDMAKAKKKR